MFKCLCGGGNINNNTNSKLTKNAPSINNLPNGSPKKPNHTKKSSLHPKGVHGGDHDVKSSTAMTKIQSSSPSPALRHINGLNKQNTKHIITTSETDNDETTVTSPSNNAHKKAPRAKHARKRTHPYKSRGDPHRNSSLSATVSPIASPNGAATGNISDYFVYDNFEFSIETFDFNLHYKFLIELAIKCLDMGPEILSPSIFFKHNDIVCCVAVLHENNHKKVPTSYRKTVINNVIGFCICYPHANCRPYPDSVWMIGWLCADHHRIRSYNAQYLVIEALIRSSYCVINPKPVSILPKVSSTLKAHLRETRDTKLYLNLHPIHQEEEDDRKKEEDHLKKAGKKKRKRRDKGIGIYAPYHHKKAQQLYEALGFEKIAKIANYYSTDREFLDDFYSKQHNEDNKENNKPMKKISTDAYLYCRGDLAHCRLLLGMEYFNYKKWPKSAAQKKKEEELKKLEEDDDEKQTNSLEKIQEKSETNKKSKDIKDKKKRYYGPKILEEYLQERIAKYHAKQNEQLLRSKQQQQNKYSNKLSSQQNATANPTKSVATIHAHNRSTNQSSQHNINKSSDKRREAQTINIAHPQSHHTSGGLPHKALHTSRHVNTPAHRSSAGIHATPHNAYSHNPNYHGGHRGSGGAVLYDKRMRYKHPHPSSHANAHQKHRSSGAAAASNAPGGYDDVQAPNTTAVNGAALSPNINHRSNISPDGGGGGGVGVGGAKTSSRHSSIANSQISHQSHHYHATHNSGHSAHYYNHYQRPTFTQSSNAGSSGGHRSSVTPTPTYGDVTHSRAMYHPPYLSNASTATYTHSLAEDHGHASLPRGNSYYSIASGASHHSGANSIHSNVSLHGDHPYPHPSGSYHRPSSHHHSQASHPHHPSHYMHPSHQSHHSGHHHHDYGAHSHRGAAGGGAHHKHHDSYNNEDPYNRHPHHRHSHKARNKRYTRSSRHSSHQKLPQ